MMAFNLKTLKEACRKDGKCWDDSTIWMQIEGLEAEFRDLYNWIRDREWRGVSSEVVEEFQERLEKILGEAENK